MVNIKFKCGKSSDFDISERISTTMIDSDSQMTKSVIGVKMLLPINLSIARSSIILVVEYNILRSSSKLSSRFFVEWVMGV